MEKNFLFELFMNIANKSFGKKKCFCFFSYYIGNNHPCINICFKSYSSLVFKIEFCKNGNINMSYKHKKVDKYKYIESLNFKLNKKVSIKKNVSILIDQIIEKAKLIIVNYDPHIYINDRELPYGIWIEDGYNSEARKWKEIFLLKLIGRLATLAIKKSKIDNLNINLKNKQSIFYSKKDKKSNIKIFGEGNLIIQNYNGEYNGKSKKKLEAEYSGNWQFSIYNLLFFHEFKSDTYKKLYLKERVQDIIDEWNNK